MGRGRPSAPNTELTLRATGSASATSHCWPVGWKFWLLKGAKHFPGAIWQNTSRALPVSTWPPARM